jgi:hypothetical protein
VSKSFGISALCLSLISIFLPVVGPYITLLSGGLAAFSAGRGFSFGLSAIILNVVNILVLSPSVYMSSSNVNILSFLTMVQIVAGLVLATITIVRKRRRVA